MQQVRVQLGRTTVVGEIMMERGTVVLSDVKVVAPRITLDPTRTTIGATLEASDYSALPAERDYKSLISILPHINTSYYGDPANSGGSSGLENMYFIDGVNVTSPLKATTGTSHPSNFVRTVQVRAGGYEAQYGRALGAVVNAVTYTGSNKLDGSVFGFFNHDGLTAEPKSQPTLRERGSYNYDIGARVGGPLIRDRLWFSAAYNPRIDHVEKTIAGLGAYSDDRRVHSFAGKLTWRAKTATNVELSVFGDPTKHNTVAQNPLYEGLTPLTPDPYLIRLSQGGTTVSLRASSGLTPSLTIDGSVARSSIRQSEESGTERGRTDGVILDFVEHTLDGGGLWQERVNQQRTAVTARGTLTVGRHTFILGTEYEDNQAVRSFGVPGDGFTFRPDANDYQVHSEGTSAELHNRVPTAYLQDSWRIGGEIIVNAGVRWSNQLLTGASGRTAQRFPNEWQPRLGFSWEPGRVGEQRIFGSYGRFYQQTPLNLSSLWYVDYNFRTAYYSSDPRAGANPDSVTGGIDLETSWANSIAGLAVENFDEFTLGYERLLGASRITLRGVRRDLRSSFQWGRGPDGVFVIGTPGKGKFSFLPPPKREYTALELGMDGELLRTAYRASYVLSRTWGNYTGLYNQDAGEANPGGQNTLIAPHQAVNSTGLLPADRTHVLKVVATRRVGTAFVAGTFITWQSGTPLNDFGSGPNGAFAPTFLVRRGSAGRTPSILDLNFRLSSARRFLRSNTRIVVDALHVGNARTPVRFDQQHFYAIENGAQTNPNPNYLRPVAFQPPMTFRLGVEIER
jgi:hypothetical protein